MTNSQTTLFVLNALMLKTQGAPHVRLFLDEPVPTLRVDYTLGGNLVYQLYTAQDWETVERAAHELDVTYRIFSTDNGLKASVTKDVDGTQVRMVFGISHDGSEAASILNRILELYVRIMTWALNPKEQIPGYLEMQEELFSPVN